MLVSSSVYAKAPTPTPTPTPTPSPEPVYGCDDPVARNYNPVQPIDNSTCVYRSQEPESQAAPGGDWAPGGRVAGASTGGQVLGAATCEMQLDEYIWAGRANNPAKVKQLQEFLNQYQGENLPVTGVYGPLTQAAISRFQVEYHGDVLSPWVPFGHQSEYLPTGHVFKTTQRWINMLYCAGTQLPMPQLP